MMSSGKPLSHQSGAADNGGDISGCKDARGPCVRFEGISLELSSFSGCQFDFARDGTLVLTFNGYTGIMTLKNTDQQQQQPQMLLCSAVDSDAGSLGVLEEGMNGLDQTDYDIALSQLEQGSDFPQQPKHHQQITDVIIPTAASPSRSGILLFSNPSAMRQVCEGRAEGDIEGDSDARGEDENRDALTSDPGKVCPSSGQSNCHPHATENCRTLANLVSPSSSLKNVSRAANNVHSESCSSLRDDALHASKANAQTGSGALTEKPSSKSTEKDPKASKNKRASRGRGGDGGENTSPSGPSSARSIRGKRARRTRDDPKPVSVSTPPEKENRARERVSCAAEIGGIIRKGCKAKHANEVTRRQGCRLGEAESVEVVISPASPGPLCRSAKAQVLGDDVLSTKEGVPMMLPMGRWGHSATMISETQMLVLGGQADDDAHQATLGDLHKFDFATRTWTRPMNCDSIPRAWHTASFVAGKNLLVIFGGEKTVDGCPECLDDIMVLDTDIDLLYPPAISGKSPTARSGHSTAIIGTDLVVFGGVRGRKWQNNVAVLDTERWHWRHPTINGSNPAPRSYHSATVVGKLMVVFGGNNQNESFDKVYVLDTGKSRWEWFCPEVVGAAPAPRTGHAAVLLPDGFTILIHGGWDPEDEGGVKNFGDVFLLDTRLWEWSRGPEALLGTEDACFRVGHTAMLARGSGNESDGNKGQRCGDNESFGWIVAFFGGQDGKGVRCSDLALVSL